MTPEQFEQAKRELMGKYFPYSGTINDREANKYLWDAFDADLTALLEQHKEMMLREELIKYDEWVFENGKAFADTKESVDEYLKNVKK